MIAGTIGLAIAGVLSTTSGATASIALNCAAHDDAEVIRIVTTATTKQDGRYTLIVHGSSGSRVEQRTVIAAGTPMGTIAGEVRIRRGDHWRATLIDRDARSIAECSATS